MSTNKLTRRSVLKSAAALAAGAAAAPYMITSTALGGEGAPAASERIGIGLIGAGNINTNYHMHGFLGNKDCVIVGVADPVRERRETMRDAVNKAYGKAACTDHADFRQMIARPDVDAVCIGTPDHWHALLSILSMRAGKDVYCEKPMMHTVVEGRQMVETAAAYARIFQTGIQQRSDRNFRFACELVRNGRIGRVHTVRVGVTGLNGGIRTGVNFPTVPVPDGFDYDLWLGPAPVKPFSAQRVERGDRDCYWYYIADYSIGFISGWGVHHIDIAQWGTGNDLTGPTEVHTTSATIPADGLIDDAVAWTAELTYANGVRVLFSSSGQPYPGGIRFEGDEGWVFVDRGRFDCSPKSLAKSVIGPAEVHLYESPEHHRNFLDGIRTRRPCAATAEIGHRATATCNLVEVSARVGRKLKWDPVKECFPGDDAANRLLSKANRTPWQL